MGTLINGQDGKHWHMAHCIHCHSQIGFDGMVECSLRIGTCNDPYENSQPFSGAEPVVCPICGETTYVDYGNYLKYMRLDKARITRVGRVSDDRTVVEEWAFNGIGRNVVGIQEIGGVPFIGGYSIGELAAIAQEYREGQIKMEVTQ